MHGIELATHTHRRYLGKDFAMYCTVYIYLYTYVDDVISQIFAMKNNVDRCYNLLMLCDASYFSLE